MMFDACQIARGWLAVATAASSDRTWPVLYRSLMIEQHTHGARLVATDGYMVLHAFVPELHHEDDEHPGLDELPIAHAVAVDYHGRAKGFLAHVLKLATGDDAEQIDIRLRLNVLADPDAQQGALEGLEARTVLIEQPDVERVVLPSFEGRFPASWRDLVGAITPVDTGCIALLPDRLDRLAKAARVHPGSWIGWTFCGPDRAASVEVIYSDPLVSGAVMPVRWDLWRNEPFTEPEPPADDEEEAA